MELGNRGIPLGSEKVPQMAIIFTYKMSRRATKSRPFCRIPLERDVPRKFENHRHFIALWQDKFLNEIYSKPLAAQVEATSKTETMSIVTMKK